MAGVELYAPRTARHRRTWTAGAIVLAVVFSIAGTIAAVLPAVRMGLLTEGGDSDWLELSYILFAAFSAGAVITLLWAAWFERRGPAALGLNGKALGRFLRGYLVGLAFLAAVVGVIWALGGYDIEGPGAMAALAPAALIPLGVLLAGFIVQGSAEELVFRGWLMGLIASRHGLVLAVILNSALFALLHGLNIEPSRELALGLANIVLFGLFISLYAAKEGSIWGVCGWHAAWNWLLGVGFGLEVSGQAIEVTPLVVDLAARAETAWWVTGGTFGPEASVVTTGVLVLGSVVLMWRGRVAGHPAPEAVAVATAADAERRAA